MKQSTIERLINVSCGRAISDYKMIADRDKILVGVSGADSLALLEALLVKQKHAPVKFSLIAVHVSANEQNADVIENYLKSKNIEYHFIDLDLSKGRKDIERSECFWCSWKRREIIFKLAGKLKCNKVAFGHHLDDIIETYLLNIFFLGEISAMPPKLKMRKGNFHIIRPFCYLEKKQIEEYAEFKNIPKMPFKCPHSKVTNRPLVRSFIENLKEKSPNVKKNIFKSMTNIKKNYLPK
ncbi:MAG: ATP-binding protein [Candidatus Omnitrophota bacterium]